MEFVDQIEGATYDHAVRILKALAKDPPPNDPPNLPDFRYQLTPIGAPGPNLHVAERVAGNCFKIAGGSAGMEVSWQVTGIRQDAYANAHRILVEEEKAKTEKGTYIHPELHNQP